MKRHSDTAGMRQLMEKLRESGEYSNWHIAKIMRITGATYQEIGDVLGMTRQGAQLLIRRHKVAPGTKQSDESNS